MTKVKSIIAFFIFLSGFLFIGESHTFFLENFQDKYVQVGYYLETGDSEVDMRNAILAKADEFGADVFAIHKDNNGAFQRKITIYGNAAVQEALLQDWGIQEGTVASFFSGKTTFIFKPFEQATEKELQNCWYIGRLQEELHPMLFPHMAEYSGNFRNSGSGETSRLVVAATWGMMGLAILLLTAYDTLYSKKELMIRVVFGASLKQLIVRKIVLDTAGLLLALLAAVLLLAPLTSITFRWPVSIASALLFFISNAIVLMLGMKLKERLQIKSVASMKQVLAFGLVFKGVITLIAIVILSLTLMLVVEGLKLYAQKDDYQGQADRVHIELAYPYPYEKMAFAEGYYEGKWPLDTSEQLMENFVRFSYRELDFALMHYYPLFEQTSPKWGDRYVMANVAGVERYKDWIPDWETIKQQEGNYILVPAGADVAEIREELLENTHLGLSDENLIGMFTYDKGLSVIAEGFADVELDYTFDIKNPVILLDAFDYGKLRNYTVSYELKEATEFGGMIARNMMYHAQFVNMVYDEDKLDVFAQLVAGEAIDADLLEFSVVSTQGWYEGLWALQNRSMLISSILTVLVLILTLQLSVLVLKIAYETNARELTIKKVMGYTLFERFKGFFIMPIVICGLAFSFSVLLNLWLGIGILSNLLWGSLIVLALDLCILVYCLRVNDRVQIQKVLKGGI